MQHFSFMQFKQRLTYLTDKFPNVTFLDLYILLFLIWYEIVKIPFWAIFHNNRYFLVLFVYISKLYILPIIVFHNEWGFEFSLDVHFLNNTLFFFFLHRSVIYLFRNEIFIVFNTLYFKNLTCIVTVKLVNYPKVLHKFKLFKY